MPLDFPNSPTVNQEYTVNGITWKYDGTAWNVISGGPGFRVSSAAPSSPATGDLWLESDSGEMFFYYDNQWVSPAVLASVGTSAIGTAQLASSAVTSQKALTSAASTITGTNSSGVSNALARADHNHDIKAVGAFSYALSAPASLPNGTWTKVPFNTKDFDVSDWYSTTTYTYTPQKAGYYLLGAFMCMNSAMTNDSHYFQFVIAKNGSHHRQIFLLQDQGFPNYPRGGGSCIVAANGTDWFEIQAFQNSGASNQIVGHANTENVDVARFWGHYLGS